METTETILARLNASAKKMASIDFTSRQVHKNHEAEYETASWKVEAAKKASAAILAKVSAHQFAELGITTA